MTSSASIVRIANQKDFSEIWRLFRESHSENALFPLAEDKINWFLSRVLSPESIPSDDVNVRGVLGVIGTIGSLEGMVLLTIGSQWYSRAHYLEEYMVYVDTGHRRSGHAKALVSWMKLQSEVTGLPLLTGILSTKRTEAKCRLYQRMLPKAGEYFLYPARKEQIMNGSSGG